MTAHDEYPPDDQPAPIATQMPHDAEAEQAVLGAMLLSPAAATDIESILGDGRAFYRPIHQTIYHAILALHGKPHTQADPITVSDYLRTTGQLEGVGGAGYIHQLPGTVPTAANGAYYAEIVDDKHQLAQIVTLTTRAQHAARNAEADPAAIREDLAAGLQALTAQAAGSGADEALSVADRWEDFIDELSSGADPDAMDSPWPDLNAKVVFKPKELTVVGAATGGGKSILALNLGAHVALRRDKPALVVSMEMAGKELLARLTAAEAEVDLSHLVQRQLTETDWQKIGRVSDRMINASNFILDDQAGATVAKIRARVRWMASQGQPPGVVIVDYMQLITPESTRSGEASRTQEVAKISRGLKLLAHEHDVPVIALAQFNRGAVGRQPMISDFKDSSQIEQDASVILLLHRPLAEDGSDTGERAGEVDVIVGKNRNGQQGVEVPLLFQGRFGRLSSLAPKSWTPSTVRSV